MVFSLLYMADWCDLTECFPNAVGFLQRRQISDTIYLGRVMIFDIHAALPWQCAPTASTAGNRDVVYLHLLQHSFLFFFFSCNSPNLKVELTHVWADSNSSLPLFCMDLLLTISLQVCYRLCLCWDVALISSKMRVVRWRCELFNLTKQIPRFFWVALTHPAFPHLSLRQIF